MGCEGFKELLMAFVDGEISPDEEAALGKHLEECGACRDELEEMEKLREVTSTMRVHAPEDDLWRSYWLGIYNRIERGIGWILTSIGAIIVLFYAAVHTVRGILNDPDLSSPLRVGILLLLGGICVLFVSVAREKVFKWKKERYKEVER